MNEQDRAYLITILGCKMIVSLEEFLKKHPDALRTPLGQQGKYAIHYVADVGEPAMAQYVCETEPESILFKDIYEQTALIFAAARGNYEMIDLLITKGSDLNAQSNMPDKPHCCLSVLSWSRAKAPPSCTNLILNAKLSQAMKVLDSVSTDKTKTAELTYRTYQEFIEDNNWESANFLLVFYSHYFQDLEISKLLELLILSIEKAPEATAQVFLAKQNKLLQNRIDDYNLMQWAVVNGEIGLVSFLHSLGADLKQTVNNPEHPDHGMSLLKLAYIHCQQDVTTLLILKLWADAKPEEYPDLMFYVQSGEQALELVGIDLKFIGHFMNDERINGLIQEELHKNQPASEEASSYFPSKSPLVRPRSFYAKLMNNQLVIFKKQRKLGEGTYGDVDLLQNQLNSEVRAVKSFRKATKAGIEKESRIFAHVYPENRSKVGTFFNAYQSKGIEIQADRMVMPYFHSVRADFKSMPAHHIAVCFYLVAKELLRIHNAGVIHGDISARNVLFCKDNTVKFVDFGFAYFANDEFATVFPKLIESKECTRMAPERRCKNNTLAPHTNQDIYSLGKLFNDYIEPCDIRTKRALFGTFRSIPDFILDSANENPQSRPALDAFCALLRNQILAYQDAHPQPGSSAEGSSSCIIN